MTNEKTGPKLSGILFFIAAILLISIVDTICKIFTTELHSLQLVWGYFLGINLTLWIFFYCRRERITNLVKTERIVVQSMRPAFLAASITSLFLGLTYLPIAEATTIGFTAPLFITALSGPILREKVGIHRLLAVVIGLVGVLVIVRPGGGLWHWASLMPFVGAIFFAVFQIITRLLSNTEKTNTTLFYTGLGGFFWTSIIWFFTITFFNILFRWAFIFFAISISRRRINTINSSIQSIKNKAFAVCKFIIV